MKIAKFFYALRDIIEKVIPIITFSILFLTFIHSVFSRYVLNAPPAWGTEVEVGAYMWTVLIGACYVRRLDKHVKFSMIYDMLSEEKQSYLRIFRNLIMGVTYAFLIKPTYIYLHKYRTISPALKIPVKIYFFPILILIVGVVCYSFSDCFKDMKLISRKGKKS